MLWGLSLVCFWIYRGKGVCEFEELSLYLKRAREKYFLEDVFGRISSWVGGNDGGRDGVGD